MKALKLIILFFLFLCSDCFSLYAQEQNSGKEIQLESQATKTRNGTTSDEGVPIKRSIQLQPAYAYLYNNVVNIDFSETFSTVIISITNEASGEIIYSETCSNPASLSIDLNDESNGNYLIEIEAEDIYLEGSFSL